MSSPETYLAAFLCGGLLCLVGQILIDKTRLTPARILVLYVVVGVVLGAVGLYQPLVDRCGAGATVPLSGCGHSVLRGGADVGDGGVPWGTFPGGPPAAAGGIAAAVFFGNLVALFFRSKPKT